MIKEPPCPIINPFQRMKMRAAVIDVLWELDYVGALTAVSTPYFFCRYFSIV